jgi:hypothetical protein
MYLWVGEGGRGGLEKRGGLERGGYLVHKITNVPVVYMGLVLSDFEGGLSITRGILGGPKNLDFLPPPPPNFVPPHISNRYINSYTVTLFYPQSCRSAVSP